MIARCLRVPLPLTVTVGKLPELVPDCLASILAGVADALASAADAAAIAIEPFIMIVIILLLVEEVGGVSQDSKIAGRWE